MTEAQTIPTPSDLDAITDAEAEALAAGAVAVNTYVAARLAEGVHTAKIVHSLLRMMRYALVKCGPCADDTERDVYSVAAAACLGSALGITDFLCSQLSGNE